jgi:protein phosphatase
VYLLCSDGLSGLVTDDQILELVMSSGSLDDACKALIDRANYFGGTDNITVVLARVEEVSGGAAAKTTIHEEPTEDSEPTASR